MGLSSLVKFFNLDMEQDYEYEEDFDSMPQEEEYESNRRSEKPRNSRTAEEEPRKQRNSFLSSKPKVMPMNKSSIEVKIFKPTGFDDSQEICDALLNSNPVIVNLEGFDSDDAQRIMDFVSGCLYSINGTYSEISKLTYIFAPDNVDIIGDINDAGSDDVMPTVGIDY